MAAELEPNPTLLELHGGSPCGWPRTPKSGLGTGCPPHMTLGRFASGTGDRVDAPVPGLPRFEVAKAVLVRSVLRPEGAEHRALAMFRLG